MLIQTLYILLCWITICCLDFKPMKSIEIQIVDNINTGNNNKYMLQKKIL